MKKSLRILSASLCLSFFSYSASAQTLSSNPTMIFTNSVGFGDRIAQDGEGGSAAISDMNIQVMPINNTGTLYGSDVLGYHDMIDWSTPPIISLEADAHYGWSIKSDNGANFSLRSFRFFDWGEWSGETFVVQAFLNGISQGTVTFSGNTANNTVNLSYPGVLTNIFQTVDEVRVYKQSGSTGWTGLNNIQVGSPAAVLPVTWLNFTAVQKGGGVQLNWRTATEQSTRDFIVKRSEEGSRWSTIGTIAAAGNSTIIHTYTFVDKEPRAGTNFYRILERGIDGKESYSKIVKLTPVKQGSIAVYPNPVVNGSFSLKLKQTTTIGLYNRVGVLVMQKTLPAGLHSLSAAGLAKGTYIIKAEETAVAFVVQ